MATDTDYAITITQASAVSMGAVIFRNPSVVPVDGTAESTQSSRVSIPHFNGQEYGTEVKSTIVSATAATPIVATLTTDDGASWTNGDLALVSGGLGDLNINGTFFTTISTDALTLVGSKTDGTYTASSATVRKLNPATSFHILLATITAAILNDKAAGN